MQLHESIKIMEVRTGTAQDTLRVASLHTDSWQAAYAGLMPASYLDGPLRDQQACMWKSRLTPAAQRDGDTAGGHLLIAEHGMDLLGFAYLIPGHDGRILLDNLHVDPAHTGGGIGRCLLRHALTWAATTRPGQSVYLEVLRDNTRATAFYAKAGGHATAARLARFPTGFELPEIEYTWHADAINAYATGH
ncbi:GNAT family N-acetyltransferase [Micromonospora sp. DT201]|uniref:GNAT family N-acetyltransferase n=1 Tax=Micromonospora sp. DT201 TaxID=3393442 RepID=UPI003CE749F7